MVGVDEFQKLCCKFLHKYTRTGHLNSLDDKYSMASSKKDISIKGVITWKILL